MIQVDSNKVSEAVMRIMSAGGEKDALINIVSDAMFHGALIGYEKAYNQSLIDAKRMRQVKDTRRKYSLHLLVGYIDKQIYGKYDPLQTSKTKVSG